MSQRIRVACCTGVTTLVILSCLEFSMFRETRFTTTCEIRDNVNENYTPPERLSTSYEPRYRPITSSSGELLPYDEQLIDDIRSHISKPSPTRPRLLGEPHKTDRSQVGQSALVDKLLSRRRNGFFVECGAADGETYSNSLFFEMARNWTGILVEANRRYLSRLLKKNRRAYVLHACLSTERRRTATGMHLSGLTSRVFPNGKSTRVNCFPLDAILKALNVSHVDYFSLDVEGPELEILHTIDWSEIQIDVLSVEYRINRGGVRMTETVRKLQQLRQFFKQLRVYREVTVLPPNVGEAIALDVVFSRV